MKNEEKIDLWDEMIGCMPCTYATNAEMKILDDDGIEKFVQLYMSSEVSNLSVSTHSLHEYDPDDVSKCWTQDTCEEFYDTFMAEEEIAEIEDEDEADRYTNYSMLIKMASESKYYALYLKLDAAVDAHVFGPGTEIEIEKTKKELLGSDHTYVVTRDCVTSDGNWEHRKTHHEEIGSFSDIDLAVKEAERLYDDQSGLPKNWMMLEVKVKNQEGKTFWSNGYSY